MPSEDGDDESESFSNFGQEPGFVPVQPQPLPVWQPAVTRIHGRDREIGLALKALRSHGKVVIAGPRDVGTSTVANSVVSRLLDERRIGGPDEVVWVDLRGNSSTEPPGPRSVAGRVLSTFNLDEPADDTAPVLADAAARLWAAASARPTVLLLDNVFHAEQVSWLTERWSATGDLPMLVIAADEPVAVALAGDDSVVRVGPLNLPAMRAVLSDELGDSPFRRLFELARGLHRDLRRDRSDGVDDLLLKFRGRPRAVREIARLIVLSGDRLSPFGALLADTGGTEPMVELWRAWLPWLMRHTLSERAKEVLRALAVLPVTGLGRDALAALLPTTAAPGYQDLVDELRNTNVVEESPPGRFRLPEEVRLAVERIDPRPVAPEVWTAISGLVRHYATQATNWAADLSSVIDAPSAIVWLHQEEPALRALLTDWRPDALPPPSFVDDLAVIADALDVWYVRELQSDGLVRTSRGLAKLAGDAGRDDLVRLAELRTAAAHRIGTHLELAEEAMGAQPDGSASFALRARWHNERALIAFDRATAVGDDGRAAAELLQVAENELHVALGLVPANDGAGRLSLLVNLAAVNLQLYLQRHRLFAAVEFLDRAERLANAGGDLSGLAHVVELHGVAAIRAGNDRDAVRRWQQALALYRDLGEEQGEARCLQHLGTLAVVRPDIAGLLDTGHRLSIAQDRAATVARDYLLRSKHLLAGQPNPTLADYYLARTDETGQSGYRR